MLQALFSVVSLSPMENLKMGTKDNIRNAAKRFEKLLKQPVSKRIADFLREEGKKENAKSKGQIKKIAHSDSSEDLGI